MGTVKLYRQDASSKELLLGTFDLGGKKSLVHWIKNLAINGEVMYFPFGNKNLNMHFYDYIINNYIANRSVFGFLKICVQLSTWLQFTTGVY